MKKILYSFLFFFFVSFSNANETYQIQVDKLFDQLKKTSNYKTAKEIETKIWGLWTTHPTKESLTKLLEKGSSYMSKNQLTSAHNVFSKVIELDPKWAEAWNKRATVLYILGEFQKSQDDIDQVLALEQRHFGALAGQGLVNIQLKNYEKAIRSYEQAQEIYPAMRSPKIMIKQIEELIKEQTV